MNDADHEARSSGPGSIPARGKRPVSLWIVSIYLLASGLLALVAAWQAPDFVGLAKVLDFLSALVQAGCGLLLVLGWNAGRRLYLLAVPVIILARALYLGSVMGFTDDDYPFLALSPFLIYGIVAFFLMRSKVENWLSASTPSRGRP